MEVNLVVVEGRPLGAVIPLRTKRFVIGRDPGCQLRPKSQAVSNHHCVLVRRNDHVTVSDLGSTNGTLVNDRCLRRNEEVRVSDGDRLQVGQLIFAIRISSDASPEVVDPGDWLLDDEADAPDDPKAHTMLLSSAMSPLVRRPSSGRSGIGRSPAAEPEGTVHFAYRRVDPAAHATILGLSPEQVADEAAFRATRKALLALAHRPPSRRMVLDLGDLETLPSWVCVLLLPLSETCRAAGGELRISSASTDVRRMLAALKLDARIECYDEASLAVAEPWD
ncbi:MAG TPA: FHA domain-containing protein [Isosphaeraceae bacterium]|jgi:anti-anti-sigma factor